MVSKPDIEHRELPQLEGKRVLIVGGTHGIGEALARKCLALGASVTVIGRTPNPELDCEQILHDVVEDPAGVEQYYVGADYVLNNLGIYETAAITDTTPERLREVLRYNLETMFLLAQYSIRHALEAVVNMSSRPTLDSYKNWSLYTLTKQGVITITQASAEEGTQKHYAICPSRVDTRFRDEVFPDEDKSTRLSPEQVADSILWLFNGQNPSGGAFWIKEVKDGVR